MDEEVSNGRRPLFKTERQRPITSYPSVRRTIQSVVRHFPEARVTRIWFPPAKEDEDVIEN